MQKANTGTGFGSQKTRTNCSLGSQMGKKQCDRRAEYGLGVVTKMEGCGKACWLGTAEMMGGRG
jgi:hypothetical protein